MHLTKTLNQLKGSDQGVRPLGTYVTDTCYRMRSKPVAELTDEELRLAIGQQMSTEILVLIALARLAIDPALSGNFLPGDLLRSLVRLGQDEWNRHPDWWTQTEAILERFRAPPTLDPEFLVDCHPDYTAFRSRRPTPKNEASAAQD